MTERARYWSRLLAEWERSGLSQAEFTRRRGVQAVSFSWWKRRLRGAKGQRRRRVHDQAGGSRPGGRGDFVEVVWPQVSSTGASASGSALPAGSGGYEVALVSGRVIRLPAAFDPAVVARLVAAVESC
jgi:hypothetical protein